MENVEFESPAAAIERAKKAIEYAEAQAARPPSTPWGKAWVRWKTLPSRQRAMWMGLPTFLACMWFIGLPDAQEKRAAEYEAARSVVSQRVQRDSAWAMSQSTTRESSGAESAARSHLRDVGLSGWEIDPNISPAWDGTRYSFLARGPVKDPATGRTVEAGDIIHVVKRGAAWAVEDTRSNQEIRRTLKDVGDAVEAARK